MIVKIEIHTCDDYENIHRLYAHLYEIQKHIKKNEKDIIDFFNSGSSTYSFDDNNCYGTHEVEILAEENKCS
jgi:spore coat polysaccharide biosynthesis protein SpsF (cytidylyltransferase family)